MLTKDLLPDEIVTERTIVRRAVQEDLPHLGAWPEYPWPHDWANMANNLARSEDGRYWWERIDALDRCQYSVVLPASGEIIGVHAFARIDWGQAVVGNMGIRIRPDMCGQGYGSETLKPLLKAVLNSGIRSVRLDVAAPNEPAIRCYDKCGMRIVDEFWREHKGGAIDPSDPKWAPLLKHLRPEGHKWMVRFYWREIGCEIGQQTANE